MDFMVTEFFNYKQAVHDYEKFKMGLKELKDCVQTPELCSYAVQKDGMVLAHVKFQTVAML